MKITEYLDSKRLIAERFYNTPSIKFFRKDDKSLAFEISGRELGGLDYDQVLSLVKSKVKEYEQRTR